MLIELFDKSKMVRAKNMQKGDIFLTEYGDYGNYIYVVFDSCEKDGSWNVTKGTHISRSGDVFDKEWVGSSLVGKNNDCYYNVVGKVIM